MILMELKTYLAKVKRAHLPELAERFQLSVEIVQAMLGHWIRKGVVKKESQAQNTKGCAGACQSMCVMQCLEDDSLMTEVYVWGGSEG